MSKFWIWLLILETILDLVVRSSGEIIESVFVFLRTRMVFFFFWFLIIYCVSVT